MKFLVACAVILWTQLAAAVLFTIVSLLVLG
jgi:hypothetical protein